MDKPATSPARRKSIIRMAFDKSAATYDSSATFQREMAKTLFERIVSQKLTGSVAMEIGCGTGELAAMVAQSGMFRATLALDISQGMTQAAMARRNGYDGSLHVAQADAEYAPVKNGSVDLCFSNLALQWIEDLPAIFSEAALSLKNGGRLIATVLGESTFHELRESVTYAFEQSGKEVDQSMFHKFPDERAIVAAAESAGLTVKIEKEIFIREFKDATTFMRSLKNIGVQSNPGLASLGLGRRAVMDNFVKEYRSRFALNGGIAVTYEVVYIDAIAGELM